MARPDSAFDDADPNPLPFEETDEDMHGYLRKMTQVLIGRGGAVAWGFFSPFSTPQMPLQTWPPELREREIERQWFN